MICLFPFLFLSVCPCSKISVLKRKEQKVAVFRGDLLQPVHLQVVTSELKPGWASLEKAWNIQVLAVVSGATWGCISRAALSSKPNADLGGAHIGEEGTENNLGSACPSQLNSTQEKNIYIRYIRYYYSLPKATFSHLLWQLMKHCVEDKEGLLLWTKKRGQKRQREHPVN